MPNATPAVLSIQPHERVVLGTVLCRELEHEATRKLQAELESALDAAPTLALVLDLSRVEFMPSLALSLMVKVHKSLVQGGRKCVLVGVHPLVHDAIRATALDRFLVLRGTVEEGLQSV
jgi:anti-anti-sigma factor